MTLPLWLIILVPYAFLAVIWIVLSLLIIANLLKYGFNALRTGFMIVLYAAGSAIILGVSLSTLAQVNWGHVITFFP